MAHICMALSREESQMENLELLALPNTHFKAI